MEKAKEEGIKWLLGFHGTLLLSTIIPDKFLNEDTFNLTLELVKKGGFDGVIGWDMPVYIDAPKMTNIINLISATSFTIRLVKERITTIPLLKDSDPREMRLILDGLIGSGLSKWLSTLQST